MSTTAAGMQLTQNAIRFVRWADSFTRPITPEDVMRRWDVSRATAYRWLKAYATVGSCQSVAIDFDHESRAQQVQA